MPGLSLGAMAAGGISFFSGLYHLVYYLGTGRRRMDLAFSFVCFAAGAYGFSCAGVYAQGDPAATIPWSRFQLVSLSLIGLCFLWFVRDLTGRTRPPADRAFFAWFLATILLFLFAPQPFLWPGPAAVKSFLLFGRFPVAYNEMAGGVFTHAYTLISLLFAIYLLARMVRAARGNQRRMIQPILVGMGVLILALVSDTFVSLGVLPFLYTLEYAFAALILGMVASLGRAQRALTSELLARAAAQRAVLQAVPDASFRIAADGTILEFHPGTGFDPIVPPERFLGRRLGEFIPPELDRMTLAQLGKAREAGTVQSFEYDLPFTPEPGAEVHHFEARLVGLSGGEGMAFIRDITDRVRSEDRLAESEERFRTIFQSSPDAMTLATFPEVVYVDVNQTFLDYTGLTREQAVGKTALELDLYADLADRDRLLASVREKGEANNLEARFKIRGGGVGTGLMSTRLIRFRGKPHLLTTIRDIGPLKAAEERLRDSLREKEVLLQEVHHRVKNNLHVISSLLDVQEHHIPDPTARDIYRESRNRVLTMALIHQTLYESKDLAQVDFAAYLGTLSRTLLASYGGSRIRARLELSLAPAQMVVDTAIPCGLIANELISNSLKHAFPGGRGGTVRVEFSITGEKAYRLTVEDDGAGMPPGFEIARSRSLGLMLVSMLTEQLGGKLTISSPVGAGTRFTVDFHEYHEAGTAMHGGPMVSEPP